MSYGYDELGRLTRVSRSGTANDGVEARYGYDPADNRTSVVVTGLPAVVGGGFESPDLGAAYLYRAPQGPARFAGNSGISANTSGWGLAAAPEGDQAGFLQSYGTASTIGLEVRGLTPGASYRFRFRIAARIGYGANPVTVSFGGAVLGTFTPGSAAFAAVASAPFTASAESGLVTFTGSASPADLGTGIDLVTVAPAGAD
ncbi:MAG TPA: RHS repeat domain-containing protein [Allosphingosinicella sp.]|nr:RHS repeat domain-containing protein [Allosphingosinicella sp.]